MLQSNEHNLKLREFGGAYNVELGSDNVPHIVFKCLFASNGKRGHNTKTTSLHFGKLNEFVTANKVGHQEVCHIMSFFDTKSTPNGSGIMSTSIFGKVVSRIINRSDILLGSKDIIQGKLPKKMIGEFLNHGLWGIVDLLRTINGRKSNGRGAVNVCHLLISCIINGSASNEEVRPAKAV